MIDGLCIMSSLGPELYSGFYKHQIDANLMGAEIMFKAMGYKHDGDGILTLDGPICPDRVIGVSQDSLIAYVECQILKLIWEEVSNINVTWLEVLEFRETHLCSPKQSIQALNYRCQERHLQHYNRSYSQVPPPPPPYACPTIPTGQLIEVDPQSVHHYDVVDAASQSQTSKCRGLDVKNNLTNSSDLDESQSNTINSWDYVYRNLESQGYSKDLGERGDILSPADVKRAKQKDLKKPRLNELEEAVNNLNINSLSPHKDKDNGQESINFEAHKTNNYDRSKAGETEVNSKKQSTKQILNGYVKTNTLPVQKSVINDKSDLVKNISVNSKTLNLTKKSNNNEHNNKDITNNQNKWQCTTCTFLNNVTREICEMCGKSKVKVQDVMEIGGSQCPRCTLVNPKDNKVCDACFGSLKDSPTYI